MAADNVFNPHGYNEAPVDYTFATMFTDYRIVSTQAAWHLYDLQTIDGEHLVRFPYYGPRSFKQELAEEALGAWKRAQDDAA